MGVTLSLREREFGRMTMSNDNLSRRSFLAAASVLLAARNLRATPQAAIPSMKDAYKNAFLIGAALDFRRPDEFNAAELDLIKSQFNVLTPENSMKPASVHPQEDTWNWTQSDALVKFCGENGIRTVGHTLVWHSQTNPWFFETPTRDAVLQKLRNHILTLVGHFKGK